MEFFAKMASAVFGGAAMSSKCLRDDCGRPFVGSSVRRKVCLGCNRVTYCSAECARADWPTHKSECSLYCTLCGARSDTQIKCQGCEKTHYCSAGCLEFHRKWHIADCVVDID